MQDEDHPVKKALIQIGITPSYLASLLQEELKAKETKVLQHKGVILTYDIPALDIRQRARMDAHKLFDHYPSERHKVEGELIIEIIRFKKDE